MVQYGNSGAVRCEEEVEKEVVVGGVMIIIVIVVTRFNGDGGSRYGW